jgi:hypothetical protein
MRKSSAPSAQRGERKRAEAQRPRRGRWTSSARSGPFSHPGEGVSLHGPSRGWAAPGCPCGMTAFAHRRLAGGRCVPLCQVAQWVAQRCRRFKGHRRKHLRHGQGAACHCATSLGKVAAGRGSTRFAHGWTTSPEGFTGEAFHCIQTHPPLRATKSRRATNATNATNATKPPGGGSPATLPGNG